MKDFNIDLKSLDSLYGVDDNGSETFKFSYEGIQNFYDNFTTFINRYNSLKEELKYIFYECLNKGLDSNNSIKNIYNYLTSLENLSFSLSLSNFFKSDDINYFVNMNRKTLYQMGNVGGRLNVFLNEFNYGLNEENQLNLQNKSSKLFITTFEKEDGDWNVDLNNSIYYTSYIPFQTGYNLEGLEYWVNSLISSNNRELGFLLYDQAKIKDYLYNLNNFIEELKNALIKNPLNRTGGLSTLTKDLGSLTLNATNPATISLNKEYWVKKIISNITITYSGSPNILGTLSISLIKDEDTLEEIKFENTSSGTTHFFTNYSKELTNSLYINKIKLGINRNSSTVKDGSALTITYDELKIESFDD